MLMCIIVGMSVHCCVNILDVNNKCHTALLFNNIPLASWYWENEKNIYILIMSEEKMHQELFVTCIAKI